MSFSDREGITAEAEAMRRQELEEKGACLTCDGKGRLWAILQAWDCGESPETCPDCDGSGLASEPPAADGRATWT